VAISNLLTQLLKHDTSPMKKAAAHAQRTLMSRRWTDFRNRNKAWSAFQH
jgi:hypothetical protein